MKSVLREVTRLTPEPVIRALVGFDSVQPYDPPTAASVLMRAHGPGGTLRLFYLADADTQSPQASLNIALLPSPPTKMAEITSLYGLNPSPPPAAHERARTTTPIAYSINSGKDAPPGAGATLLGLARTFLEADTVVTMSPVPRLEAWLKESSGHEARGDPESWALLAARHILFADCPVAKFHMKKNGARLDRVNPLADTSDTAAGRLRTAQSRGLMVNYKYSKGSPPGDGGARCSPEVAKFLERHLGDDIHIASLGHGDTLAVSLKTRAKL